MPTVTIRGAVETDAPLILDLIRGLAEYERLAHECVATEENVRESLFGATRSAEVIIAEVDGEAAGFALFFHNYSTFLAQRGIYLEDLFVYPRFRGHGIGKRLLARLAAIALERRCGRLDWAVLDWNEPAIGFYRRLGATMMDDWRICRLTGAALRELSASA